MEVFDAIRSRRSVRKYKDKQVPWDNIVTIMQAGKYAPSAGNLQNWKFIYVKTDAKRQAIAKACLGQDWMEPAPVFIVVVAEPEKAERYYGTRGARLYTTQGCAAAIQNMLLTAHSLGLGTCWIGAFDEDGLSSTLGIIEEVRPQIVLTIGYTNVKPLMPTRYKLENVVFLEKYGNRMKDAAATMGLHYAKIQRGIGKTKDILDKVNKKVFRRE